jgi:hypothetical protein
MSCKEADPAALFRLYINYGRYAEATNLLVEYLESLASSVNGLINWKIEMLGPPWEHLCTITLWNNLQRPVDVLHRKKMSATWFPYTAIERLWGQLEEMQRASHSVDQCDRLKKLLHGALMSHLQQVKPHLNAENSVSALTLIVFLALPYYRLLLTPRTCCLQWVAGREGRTKAAEGLLLAIETCV